MRFGLGRGDPEAVLAARLQVYNGEELNVRLDRDDSSNTSMAIIDNIRDAVTKVVPQKREELPTSSGHGVYPGEDVSPLLLCLLLRNSDLIHLLVDPF